MAEPEPSRPMTDFERELARLLSPDRVTYVPGSPDKRMARAMAALAGTEVPQITEPQAGYLRRLAFRYRRQAPVAVTMLMQESEEVV